MTRQSRLHAIHHLIDRFPYGKAPLVLFVIAILSTALWFLSQKKREPRPDLILVTFSEPQQASYRKAMPEFEKQHGVKVDVQMAHWGSLQTRLQNAILADTDVPDVVEMLEGSLGFFARGPEKDIGLLDLTSRINAEHLRERMVDSRFILWSARGRIFGLPHDIHPVMLAYRRDLVEALGIDVNELDTWDKFVEVGRRVTRDTDGDGVIDQYMLDLPFSGAWGLQMLMLQRGIQLFDEQGNPVFATQQTAEVFRFYLEQTLGKKKIAYDCGWGQPFFKAVTDGLALFYITPDWRSYTYQTDLPNLSGKMAVMPLPAWEKGGRRTSVWGGTGLVITRHSKRRDLAWELAKYLYLTERDLGERYKGTNIIPPLKKAWNLPEFNEPNPYFSGQPIGKLYAELAPDTPPVYASPIINVARSKVDAAYTRAIEHYRAHGDDGLMEVIQRELQVADQYVRKMAERNKVLQGGN
jgi:arabinosaccharide transport system substrate-binding protein